MPSVNSIALIGKVINQPKIEHTQYNRYLSIELLTHDVWRIGTEHKAIKEVHKLRLYGALVDRYSTELEANDIIYVDGSIKTIDQLKHISVRTFRLIAKRSPGDLLPPDVTLETQDKWS